MKKITTIIIATVIMLLVTSCNVEASVSDDYDNFSVESYIEDSTHQMTKKEKSKWEKVFQIEFDSDSNDFTDGDTKYHYPVVKKDQKGFIIYYTNDEGLIQKRRSDESIGCILGQINDQCDEEKEEKNEEVIFKSFKYCLIFSEKTAEIQKWEKMEVTNTISLPEGSIYTGYSFLQGFIFRAGTDVYAVVDEEVLPIAHKVKEVVVTDYKYTSDSWSQPLFLMEDGTLKVYQCWEKKPSKYKSDDPKLLHDVITEGGFRAK